VTFLNSNIKKIGMKEKNEVNYDELIKKIPNKYVLTIIAGKRAREIDVENATKEVIKTEKKVTSVRKALLEISEGKIVAKELNEDEE